MLVFHHIPRTGGTTLEASLVAAGLKIAYNKEEITDDTDIVTTHHPYETYDLPGKHITIIRHPVSRVISYVRFKRMNRQGIGAMANNMPLKRFLTSDLEQVRHEVPNRHVRQLGSNFHDEKPIEQAYELARERIRDMWWVGHTTSLDEDLDRLFDMLGLENPKLNRLNQSRTKHFPGNHPILWEINRWDLRLYDDLFELRPELSPTGPIPRDPRNP